MAIHTPPSPDTLAVQSRLYDLTAATPPPCFGKTEDVVSEDDSALREAADECNSKCDPETRATCGLYALLGSERYGVWGGMTPYDRKTVKKLAKKADPEPATLPGLETDTTHQHLRWAVDLLRSARDARKVAA